MATNKDFIVKSGLQVQGTTNATSTSTGALIVAGGAGIAGDLWVGGNIFLDGVGLDTVQGTTATFKNIFVTGTNVSSSTSTGAVTIAGGLGVGGNIYGTAIYDNGSRVLTADTIGNFGVSSLTAGTDTAVSGSTGAVTIWNNSTLQTITSRGATTNVALSITNTTDSSSTTTGALILSGGAGIGKNLYVNGNTVLKALSASGAVTFSAGTASTTTGTGALVLTNNGGLGVGGQLTAQLVKVVGTTTAGAGSGALQVAGGTYIGDNLYIASTAANTGTATANALYVAGGAYVEESLVVSGPAVFKDTVVFSGTATYVLSTNTVYTDNLFDIHINGDRTTPWTVDDGKDIGWIFHYYKGEDKRAFLGYDNEEDALVWYRNGVENGGGTYTPSECGKFIVGDIVSRCTTTSVSTTTGAVQVAGGIGVAKDVYVGGKITIADATDSTANNNGALILSGGAGIAKSVFIGANATVQGASAAAGAVAGNALQVTAGGLGVAGSGYFGGALKIASSTNATSTSTGALQVNGGAGIGGDVYVKGIIDTINTTDAGLTSPGASGALRTDGGAGIAKNLAVGGTISRTGNLSQTAWTNSTGVAVNIAAATYTDTSTGAGTNAGPNVANWFGQPTFASTNAVTYTNAATVYIQNAPAAGTNTTLTNPYALLVANGTVRIATTTNASSTTTGALQIVGGVGIGGSVYAGPIFSNGSQVITSASLGDYGVSTIAAGTDTVVSTSTGAVTIWNNSTLQTITSRGATTNVALTLSNTTLATSTTTGALKVSGGIGAANLYATGVTASVGTYTSNVFVTGTTDSSSASTGALQVSGGVGIAKNLYVAVNATVAGKLTRSGNITATGWGTAGAGLVLSTATYTDSSLTGVQAFAAVHSIGRPTIAASSTPTYTDAATLYIDNAPLAGTNATITNPWSLYVANGNVKINAATVSNSTSAGALVVVGGVGIGGNLNVGGSASFAATGVVVGNTQIGSYTSGNITTNSTQNLDTFSTSTYRSAKYTVQVVDGTKVHMTEMMVYHDNTTVYIMEYGISTNTGELGSFDATLAAGTITLTFTPNYTPTAMVIKANRSAITA
jgi:hypothetical protein